MGGSWMTLISKSTEMKRIGQEIRHVHPLKFLEYIFKHAALPAKMDAVQKNSLTWNPFVKGLSEKLQKEAQNLPGCILGFARSVNVNTEDIKPFFARRNWAGLVQFLIAVKLNRKSSVWVEPPRNPTPIVDRPPPQVAVVVPPPQGGPPPNANETLLPPQNTEVVIPSDKQIANLPLSQPDQQVLSSLIEKYATYNQFWMVANWSAFDGEWFRMGKIHPLKLLVHLYQSPNLMTQMKTISTLSLTGPLFNYAFNQQLSKLPSEQVLPYLDDFAQKCGLQPQATRMLIEQKSWNEIRKDLVLSHESGQAN